MKFLKIILLALFSAVSLFAISEEQIKPTMQKTTQDAIEVLKNANLSKEEKYARMKVYEALKKSNDVYEENFTFNTLIAACMEALSPQAVIQTIEREFFGKAAKN